MTVRSYKDLEVWQLSMSLVTDIYSLTKSFPKEELYSLTNQLRRAAVSVPSNIAEGRSKSSTRDFMRFVDIAYGSVAEIETQLLISQNLGYTTTNQIQELLDRTAHIGRMLNGLSTGLGKRIKSSPTPAPRPPIPFSENSPLRSQSHA
jgi:four helix bundle protein